MTEPAKDCSTCRYVSKDKRPKIMSETGFDDQLMFEDADKDETIYTCRAFLSEADSVMADALGQGFRVDGRRAYCEHAGKEIGTTPITCKAYAPPQAGSERLSALDKMIAEREARAAKADKEGG